MSRYLIITVLGDDRPGLVEAVSQVIAAHGGNWLESRMARLAGKFAGVLRASVPDTQTERITHALEELETHGLRLLLDWSTQYEPAEQHRWLTLDLLGTDRPGIIHEIAHALAERGINIDELYTAYHSAPMSGETLFKATALLRLPLDEGVVALQEHLEHLAHDLMVDIHLEPVTPHAETRSSV